MLDDTHNLPDRYRVQVFRIGIQVFRIDIQVFRIGIQVFRIEVRVSSIEYVHTCDVVHGVPTKDIVVCVVCGLCSVWLCGAWRGRGYLTEIKNVTVEIYLKL